RAAGDRSSGAWSSRFSLWWGSARGVCALAVHDLEALAQLQVAGVLEGGGGAVLVGELLATQLAAATDLPGLAHQAPAAKQVPFEHQLHEFRGFAAFGALLQEHAHGTRIVRRGPMRGPTGAGPRAARRRPRPGAGVPCLRPPRAPGATRPQWPSCPAACAPAAPPDRSWRAARWAAPAPA